MDALDCASLPVSTNLYHPWFVIWEIDGIYFWSCLTCDSHLTSDSDPISNLSLVRWDGTRPLASVLMLASLVYPFDSEKDLMMTSQTHSVPARCHGCGAVAAGKGLNLQGKQVKGTGPSSQHDRCTLHHASSTYLLLRAKQCPKEKKIHDSPKQLSDQMYVVHLRSISCDCLSQTLQQAVNLRCSAPVL